MPIRITVLGKSKPKGTIRFDKVVLRTGHSGYASTKTYPLLIDSEYNLYYQQEFYYFKSSIQKNKYGGDEVVTSYSTTKTWHKVEGLYDLLDQHILRTMLMLMDEYEKVYKDITCSEYMFMERLFEDVLKKYIKRCTDAIQSK
jgi:hypothetical protein